MVFVRSGMNFFEEWKDDDELPQYLVLGDLALYFKFNLRIKRRRN